MSERQEEHDREGPPEIVFTGAGRREQEPPPPPEAVQPLFPNLEILEVMGRGGMGVVYKARQRKLDRLVALKILAPELAKDPTFEERFLREARALAKLNHPSIVGVHDFGEVEGCYFLLMEFVDGVGLRDMLEGKPLTPAEALALVPQICEGLHYAHDHGVVHRDIKPENILIDKRGHAKIADFGLAKLVGTNTVSWTLTQADQAMGTPHYMAPEQMNRPLEVDHRADIYSLGVVFYEMLTGELPLGRFELPSEKVKVDVRLDDVVLKALEREPGRRYQHASEVKTDVEGIGSSANAGVDPVPGEGIDLLWADRLPLPRLDVALGSLLVSGALVWLLWTQGHHRSDLIALVYPFAFLPLRLLAEHVVPKGKADVRRGVLVLSFAASVFVLAALGSDFYSTGRSPYLEIFSGLLLVGAHWIVDRWFQRGERSLLMAAAALYILAAVVHGGRFQGFEIPEREGFYSLMGFFALHCGTSAAMLLPSYITNPNRITRQNHLAVARCLIPGAVTAMVYFTHPL